MTNETFTITPMTGPGVSQARMTELMLPIEKSLDSLGIRYDSSIVEYPTYYDHYQAEVVGFSEYAVNADQYGGRLVPRSSVLSNNSAVTNAFRHMADGGADIILVGAAPSKQVAGDVYNAVHPAWRSNLASVVVQTKWSFAAPWEDMIAKAVEMTEVLLPPLIDATPGSGVYLNEVSQAVVDGAEGNAQLTLHRQTFVIRTGNRTTTEPTMIVCWRSRTNTIPTISSTLSLL